MRRLVKRAGAALRGAFETTWNYLGSLAAVCILASVLGLGIYHAVVADAAPLYYCYAGVHNPPGAMTPEGVLPMGPGATPAVPHVRMEYDALGRLQRMKGVDAEGRLCRLPGSQVAEQRMHYDAAGRLMRRENLGPTGTPAEDAQGVAQREFERDAAGRVVRTRFRNAAGALISPRYPGYAECRVSYDEEARPLRVEYLDAAGNPVRNAAGEEVVVYAYGADGSAVRSNYVDGRLADNFAGVAREEFSPCAQGTCRSWKNAAGEPVIHPALGAAAMRHETSAPGGVERRSFLGVDGAPCDSQRACAEHLVRSNSSGLPEWECFGGADGLPVNHPALGYAERVCQYAADGSLEREYFWDAAGLPAPTCERRHVDTHAGAYTLSLHSDGSTTVQPE